MTTTEVAIAFKTDRDQTALKRSLMSLKAILSETANVSHRFAGFDVDDRDVTITVVISLGTAEDVLNSTPVAREALVLIARLTNYFTYMTPYMREVPAANSSEALDANRILGTAIEQMAG